MFIVVCGRAGRATVGQCVGTFPTLDEARADAKARAEADGETYTVAQVIAIASPARQPVVFEVAWEKP